MGDGEKVLKKLIVVYIKKEFNYWIHNIGFKHL